ncbi:MAG: efflux RND transporter periplasmic adaptor subunit [Acidobacteria bacterium]|nr:efflux RND transporter periplasmic adaptor subunit [Acidobacteriota bacterium]
MAAATTSRRSTRIIIGGAGLVVVVGGVLGGFMLVGNASSKGAAPAPATPAKQEISVPVQVERPTRGTVSAALSASSTLETEQQADVLAKTDGLVTRLLVDEGSNVSKGQTLAELEDADKRIALQQARLRADAATREYDRAKRSHSDQLISQQDFDRLSNTYELAQADVDSAALNLSYTKIVAPFAGRIVDRAVVQGRHIKPGEKLFTLANLTPLVARVYLPEKDVTGLKIGQAAELSLDAAGGQRLPGRVTRISPVVDTNTGTIKVTVEAIALTPAARPGSYATIRIVTDTHRDALLVPKGAIVREDATDYLFVADGNTAKRRKVTLGYPSDGRIEVAAGLTGLESVVIAGQGSLKDGARVDVRKAGS